MATANKFAEPVRAKTHTAGCKTSFKEPWFKWVLHLAVCASTCCLRAKIAQIASHTCGVFTSQTTRKGSQKSFGMTIIFCVHLRSPARDSYEERALPLRSPCACRKFKMKGKRRKVASKQLRDTYLCLAFHLRSPCQIHVKWVQLKWLVLVKCWAAWLARGTHRASTRSTPHGTNTCLLNVSCSNFGCSVKVWLGELIRMNSRIQMKQLEKEDS
jgi:hypothetical protein